jgi:hypothetical protein
LSVVCRFAVASIVGGIAALPAGTHGLSGLKAGLVSQRVGAATYAQGSASDQRNEHPVCIRFSEPLRSATPVGRELPHPDANAPNASVRRRVVQARRLLIAPRFAPYQRLHIGALSARGPPAIS